MATVDQVQQTVADAVLALLEPVWSSFPACQVGTGFPVATAISEIIGEGEMQITVYAITKAAQNRTGFKPHWVVVTPIVNNLVATVVHNNDGTWTITFSGTPSAGLNIHTLIGTPKHDVYYKTLVSDTLNTIASAVSAAINSAAIVISGNSITSIPTGPSITVSGPPLTLTCGIGGSTTMAQEVRRTMIPVQVSVWAPNAATRDAVGAILENGIGVDFPSPFLRAPDGAAIWIRARGAPDRRDDTSQNSYSLYEWHGIYECEYPTLQVVVGTQIEDVINTLD